MSRQIASILLLLALCAIPAPWASGAIQVEGRSGCLDPASIDRALSAVLEGRAKTLVVTVAETPAAGDSLVVSLRAVVAATGAVVLEREFPIRRVDCPTVGELTAVILAEFLREAPTALWAEPVPPTPQPPERLVIRDVAHIAGVVMLGASSQWFPAGGDLDAGLAVDVGSDRHRLTGSLSARLGVPQPLGTGHHLDSTFLIGLGWRFAREDWMIRVEARAGAVLAAGVGFEVGYSAWLPWVEAQAALLWRWGGVLVGPLLSVSPLRQELRTTQGDTSQVPWLRVGLTLAIPLWFSKV